MSENIGIAIFCVLLVSLIVLIATSRKTAAAFKLCGKQPKAHHNGDGEFAEMGYIEMHERGTSAIDLSTGTELQTDSSPAIWYDVNWARDVKCNLGWLVLQDSLALLKSLVASVTLFYLTRAKDLLTCSAVKFRISENLQAIGASSCYEGSKLVRKNYKTIFEQPLIDNVPISAVIAQCKPVLETEKNDTSFLAMIVCNQLLFLIFIVLRAAATKGWLSDTNRRKGNGCCTRQSCNRHSLRMAQVCTLLAVTLSVIKIVIALSYRHAKILFTGPNLQPETIKNYGLYGKVGNYTVPSAANCSQIQTYDGHDFITVRGPFTEVAEFLPKCTVPIICARHCYITMPVAIYILCFMYLFSSSYIAYLAFEYHKMIVLGGAKV